MTQALHIDLSPELIHAFEQTLFEVYGTAPITLQIGQRAEQVTGWLDACQARNAVVITAWNPFGRSQAAELNDRANGQLLDEIDQRQLRHRPARGVSSTDDWHEDSFCVLDVSEALISDWLTRYRQAAVVVVRHGQAPALAWHPMYRAAKAG